MIARDPNHVYAFISCARQDHIIGETIEAQLNWLAEKGRGRYELRCVLENQRHIPPGARLDEVISDYMHVADWLIIVFTVEQSAYSGFEIGICSKINGLLSPTLICLHDVDEATARGRLHPISRIITGGEDIDSPYEYYLKEYEIWWNTPVAEFLRNFCQYIQIYTSEPYNLWAFKFDVITAAKEITRAFRQTRGTPETADLGTLIRNVNPHMGARSLDLTEIIEDLEVDDYGGEWVFRGQPRAVIKALRIPYRHPIANIAGVLATDYLLIGYEASERCQNAWTNDEAPKVDRPFQTADLGTLIRNLNPHIGTRNLDLTEMVQECLEVDDYYDGEWMFRGQTQKILGQGTQTTGAARPPSRRRSSSGRGSPLGHRPRSRRSPRRGLRSAQSNGCAALAPGRSG
jgi:hypothetical protein